MPTPDHVQERGGVKDEGGRSRRPDRRTNLDDQPRAYGATPLGRQDPDKSREPAPIEPAPVPAQPGLYANRPESSPQQELFTVHLGAKLKFRARLSGFGTFKRFRFGRKNAAGRRRRLPYLPA